MIDVRRIAIGVLWGSIGMMLLTIALTARAGEAEVTWVAPLTRCDGSQLTNLAGYSMIYGQSKQELPLAPLSTTVTGLKPGTWWFSLAAVDAAGERSEFVTVEKTIAPEDFVTLGGGAFTLTKSDDRMLFVRVGSVPAGVVCDAAQPAGKYYVVPRSAVTWGGSVRPLVVFADCG